MESTFEVDFDVSYEPAPMSTSVETLGIEWKPAENQDGGIRFMKGLLFGMLLSLPIWAVIIWIAT